MAELQNDLKAKLVEAITRLERGFSKAKFTLKDNLHWLEPIMIVPYYGFGNERYVYLKGRVIEDEKITEPEAASSNLEHLRNTFKRFESDEIPGIRVKASFAGQQLEVKTDEEGFFTFEFFFDSPVDYARWGHTIPLTLLESKTEQDRMEAQGHIFVPDQEAEFGVISDIDDTVLVSEMTNVLGRLKRILLQDVTERSPFPGIGALLQALVTGFDAQGKNPLFYVSGSEWNLFDFLTSFFRYHHIPEGPLLLRDKGAHVLNDAFNSRKGEHKLEHIRHILKTYPHLKFICIGDSGQHDPEIYQRVVEEFPGRILGIYIRDVSSEERDRLVHQLARTVTEQGVPMLLVDQTLTAAEHACAMKWINPDQLAAVRQACEADEASR